jgi:hypothetical protein
MKHLIHPELQALIPRLTEEEARRLRLSIETDRIDEPLVYWSQSGAIAYLLDGHNRLPIFRELRIQPTIVYVNLPNLEAVKEWVISRQLARRNLTNERRRYYIGKMYQGAVQQKRTAALSETVIVTDSKTAEVANTSADVAREVGVSPRTVERAAEFASAVDAAERKEGTEAKQQILNGTAVYNPAEFVRTHASPNVQQALKEGKVSLKWAERIARKGTHEEQDRALRCELDPNKGKPKPGQVLFDWRNVWAPIGRTVRLADQIAVAYPAEKNGTDFNRCLKLMGEFVTRMKA